MKHQFEKYCKDYGNIENYEKALADGKHFTEESKKKMSDAKKGKHWYNNGKINVMTKECPEGFVPGCLH